MAVRNASIIRRSLTQPHTTLSYLAYENGDKSDHAVPESTSEKPQEFTKTERSVRFAAEYESVTEEEESSRDSLKTSQNIYLSEHLYSGDTFIAESQTALADSTDPSYDTNTFIGLESEEETRTASDISHSESLASSTVFTSPQSHSDDASDSSASREWKDVTDIVKDIDELEESEFVTKRESFFSQDDEATDISESEDEEMAAIQREHFLMSTIRRLKLKDVLGLQSPADLQSVSLDESEFSDGFPKRPVSKEEAAFCRQMIDNCKKPKKDGHESQDKSQQKPKAPYLEHFGLSSAVVDRIKMENFQHRLAKKSAKIDKEIQKSREFKKKSQEAEAAILRQKFISMSLAQVQRENTEERIQAHLIKMHPIKCFAEFLNGLPKCDEDSREILYKYKRKLEAEMETSSLRDFPT